MLLNPLDARRVVGSCNKVGESVEDFRQLLGLDRGRQAVDARRWRDAAADVRDKVLESGADGVDTARRFGVDTLGRARAATSRCPAASRTPRPDDVRVPPCRTTSDTTGERARDASLRQRGVAALGTILGLRAGRFSVWRWDDPPVRSGTILGLGFGRRQEDRHGGAARRHRGA
jgi:hypothetical protein